MKLTRQQAASIRRQTGVRAIPDDAAAAAGLHARFGDQTFFADGARLIVFELVTRPSGEIGPLLPIQLAAIRPGAEEGQVLLKPVAPRPSGAPIELVA